MRPDYVLHDLAVHLWTPDEVFLHLEATFDRAARQRPDLMEPYMIRLADLEEEEQIPIMREALGATCLIRHRKRSG